MTPQELDQALLDAEGTQSARGAGQNTTRSPRAIDFTSFIPPTMRGTESAREEAMVPAPLPPRQHRCVPPAYAVGPVALKARMAPKLRIAVEQIDPAQRYGVLLLGPSGCGKSAAAAFIVQRWRQRVGPTTSWRERVFWLDALKVTDAERRYRLGSGEPEVLGEAYRAEWLVIDDIGLSTSPSLVQVVMAHRYQMRLPTIATSGLTREQLAAHLGAATVRRIVEFEGKRGLLVDCHGGKAPVPSRERHGMGSSQPEKAGR